MNGIELLAFILTSIRDETPVTTDEPTQEWKKHQQRLMAVFPRDMHIIRPYVQCYRLKTLLEEPTGIRCPREECHTLYNHLLYRYNYKLEAPRAPVLDFWSPRPVALLALHPEQIWLVFARLPRQALQPDQKLLKWDDDEEEQDEWKLRSSESFGHQDQEWKSCSPETF
ncbi:unnamed protein product [Cylicocyclus nassatus]|uniref:Uncharacterized protein n=1 Tax=Cylicocyclus nassatus TaxID=53992 RepID=A0AA36GTP5_CYLNA|nr:unnamed protein product [Cylicocyclus nassatus]